MTTRWLILLGALFVLLAALPSASAAHPATTVPRDQTSFGDVSSTTCGMLSTMRVQAAPVWKRSAVWTGDQGGPRDARGLYWNDPAFDNSSWSAVALPEAAS